MKRYTLLTQMIRDRNVHLMVEIGVGSGITAFNILHDVGIPSFKLIGIDPYEPYDEYNCDVNSKPARIKANRESMLNLMRPYINAGQFRMLYEKSKDAVTKNYHPMTLPAGEIDLVFVDGNHDYEYVRDDIKYYFPLLREGGIMVFHDYDRPSMFPGVQQAVDNFRVNNGRLNLTFLGDLVYIVKPIGFSDENIVI